MGSSLNVYIKRKNKPMEDKICLFWLSTTPARELYDVLPMTIKCSFGDNGNDNKDFIKPLTNEVIQNIIEFYDNQIKDYKKYQQNEKENITKYENRLIKVSDKDIYNQIEEDISGCKRSIVYYDEEIENTIRLKNKFELAKETLGANQEYVDGKYEDECELYYSLN